VAEFNDTVFACDNSATVNDSGEGKTTAEKAKALTLIETFLKKDAPDDATFETLVRIGDYGNGTARIILQHYEEGMRGNRIITEYQLEHLMPQKGTDFWFEIAGTKDLEQYGKIVNSIGNLFVIDAETNNQVKNKPYKVKKILLSRSFERLVNCPCHIGQRRVDAKWYYRSVTRYCGLG
jgi:hypothetical protein